MDSLIDVVDKNFQKYFDKVLNFLSYRSRSEYEINFYMLRKGWPEEIREKVIEKLKHLGLINDEDFAKQWLASRTTVRPAGKLQIKMELRKKGVAKEIIERLLLEERTSSAEEMLAEKLCRKKIGRLKNLPVLEQKNKLYGLLARKGFSGDVAVGVIDKLFEKE